MTIDVQILNLTKIIFTGQATMVIAPGEDGDFGILPHHAPMISRLKKGIIFIYQTGAVVDQISVEKGWVNITQNHCSFLIE